MSSRAFSAKLEVSDANTRNYLDRGSKPNSDYLEKVIRNFESVNPTWLLLGEGEIFLPSTSPTHSTTITANKDKGHTGGHNTVTNNSLTLEDCHRELMISQKQVELLQEQLAGKDVIIEAKDALIAAKEEMLVLLRGGHNRPN